MSRRPPTVRVSNFPFLELDEQTFHQLVLGLAMEDPEYQINDYGQKGKDKGIDILAYIRNTPYQQNNIAIIQVKRFERIYFSDVKEDIIKLGALKGTEFFPHRYILATSDIPNASFVSEFISAVNAVGVEAQIWNKSTLTNALAKHPHLIQHYFGKPYHDWYMNIHPEQNKINHLINLTVSSGSVLLLGSGAELSNLLQSMEAFDFIINQLIDKNLDVFDCEIDTEIPCFPRRTDILNGRIDEKTCAKKRLEVYRKISERQKFLEIFQSYYMKFSKLHLASEPWEFLCTLLEQETFLGIVQLIWDRGLGQYVQRRNEDALVKIEICFSDSFPTKTPFIWILGQDVEDRPNPYPDANLLEQFLFNPYGSGFSRKIQQVPLLLMDITTAELIHFEAIFDKLAISRREVFMSRSQKSFEPHPYFLSIALSPLDLIRKLLEEKDSFSLDPFCRKLTFNGTPDYSRIFNSEPLEPQDTQIGLPSLSLSDDYRMLMRDGQLLIRDISGSGKTFHALFIAKKFHEHAGIVWYLDCAVLGQTTVNNTLFAKLFKSLENHKQDFLLIIDNFHLVCDICIDIKKWFCQLQNKFSYKSYIIFIETTDIQESHIDAGNVVVRKQIDPINSHEPEMRSWEVEKKRLIIWLYRVPLESLPAGMILDKQRTVYHDAINADNLKDNATTWGGNSINSKLDETFSFWHFFFVCRGGTVSLNKDIAIAQENHQYDIIWFALCLGHVFDSGETRNVKNMEEFCLENNLISHLILEKNLGIWVEEGLEFLVRSRLLIAHSRGVMPRHSFEAANLVRFFLSEAKSPYQQRFRLAALRQVKRIIRPIRITDSERKLFITGQEKWAVYSVVDNAVKPVLNQMRRYEIALVSFHELDLWFREVWNDVINLINEANIHSLYWFFNRTPEFGEGVYRFNLFEYIDFRHVLGSLTTVSSAIDFSVSLDSMTRRKKVERRIDQYNEFHCLFSLADVAEFQSADEKHKFLEAVVLSELLSLQEYGLLDEDISNAVVHRFKSAISNKNISNQTDMIVKILNELNDTRRSMGPFMNTIRSKDIAKTRLQTGMPVFALNWFSIWIASDKMAREIYDQFSIEEKKYLVSLITGEKLNISSFHVREESSLYDLFLLWWAGFEPKILPVLNRRIKNSDRFKFLYNGLAQICHEVPKLE
ncbi:MAG: hypothetical protein H7833_13345 [Magnetococcus sp. DMHC-1]